MATAAEQVMSGSAGNKYVNVGYNNDGSVYFWNDRTGDMSQGGQVRDQGMLNKWVNDMNNNGIKVNFEGSLADAYGARGNGRSGGGASGGSSYTDTAAARNATQQAINATYGQEDALNRNADDQYNALLRQYDQEMGDNRGQYGQKKTQNETDLAQARQLTRANGALGIRSLLAQLGAMGAGGSGIDLAGDAVQTTMNKEFGQSNDTSNKNQQGLDTWLKQLERDDRQRRDKASQTLGNTKMANRADSMKARQSMLEKMADLWNQAGNKAQASAVIAQAGGMNNDIAASSRQRQSFTPEVLAAASNAPTLQAQGVKATAGNDNAFTNSQINQPDANANMFIAPGQEKKQQNQAIYA